VAKNFGAELARQIGLATLATMAPFRGGCAVGAIEGYPVVAGLAKRANANGVLVHVRWKKDSLTITPDALKERFGTSPEILGAMEKKSLSNAQLKSLLTVEADGASLFWTYAMRTPSVERVGQVVRSLVTLASSNAQPVGDYCEACDARAGDLYLVNGIDLRRLCASDRQRAEAADNDAIEAYRALKSRPLVGLLFGAVAAIAAALVWAGIALAIHRVFAYVAVAIGLGIGFAIFRGAGKIDLFGRAATVVLTIASVILGQFIYVLVTVANAAHVPLSLELASRVAERFVAIEFSGSSGYLVLAFALVGAGAVFWMFRSPVTGRQFVLVPSPSAQS
jgi:hypothetical protein